MEEEALRPEVRNVRIRDHYEIISEMMRGLHESERELFNKTDDWEKIKEGYMRHVMEMQEEHEGTCLIAYANGVPAGFIFGYLDEEDEDSRIEAYTGKDLYVSDGFVLAAYRRLGVYRILNEELERIYIQLGVRRMLRFTLTSNVRMQRFLENEGYSPVRYLYEKWLTDDGKGILPLSLNKPS